MMTRKHYRQFADDLRQWAKPNMTRIAYRHLVDQISTTMSEDNPRHSQVRFFDACGIEDRR